MTTTTSENLQGAGQVSIDSAIIISTNGVGFNVLNQIAYFDVYEDLFSPFITGTITLYESVDLLNLFPLVGEEVINLAWHTPTIDNRFKRSGQFYIYKMSDLTTINDKSNIYVLHFISLEAVINLNTKISKTFSGKVSDIAKMILTDTYALNSKKTCNIEISANATKFTSNFWSPMKCLDYITATGENQNHSATYLFFENAIGLNFVTLDSIYTGNVTHAFYQNNYSRDISSTGTTVRDVAKDYQKIKSLDVPEGFDYIDRCMGGMYGSTLITVDPVTKKYDYSSFFPLSNFDKTKHLNDFSIVAAKNISSARQAMLYVPKHFSNFEGFADVTNASVIQQRTSLLKQADGFRINISVFGRSDHTVGQKVYVEVPSKQPLNKGDADVIDKVLSGNYIIAAIHHNITRARHTVDMELIKDSLMININKGGK